MQHPNYYGPLGTNTNSGLYSVNNQKTAAGLDALLYGNAQDIDALSEFLALNRVILGNGGFCILVAKVNFQPDKGFDIILDANALFAEKLEARLAGKVIYYMLPIRGYMVCLVAMPQAKPDSKRLVATNRQLLDSARAASEEFARETELQILAAVSPTCFGLDSIPGTFYRNMDLLDFYHFFGTESGICESPNVMPKRRVRLSSELQDWVNSALNLLLADQRQEFYAMLDRHLENLRYMVPCSLQQYQNLAYQYLDLLFYNLVDHNLADTTVMERVDLYWIIHEHTTYCSLVDHIHQVAEQLLTPVVSCKRQQSNVTAEKIKTYLQLHHRDHNLTISSAASAFGMSQPIFSAFFIKQVEMGPLDYLNRIRVQTAMELLRTTDEILPNIATASGFGSVSTMHRIFKKVTGMTPAHLRNRHQS